MQSQLATHQRVLTGQIDLLFKALTGPAPVRRYDPKCYDLASKFLDDHPKINTGWMCSRLATIIQEAIDEGIKDLEAEIAALEAQQ